jgi:hypothetical protein
VPEDSALARRRKKLGGQRGTNYTEGYFPLFAEGVEIEEERREKGGFHSNFVRVWSQVFVCGRFSFFIFFAISTGGQTVGSSLRRESRPSVARQCSTCKRSAAASGVITVKTHGRSNTSAISHGGDYFFPGCVLREVKVLLLGD